MNNCGGALGAHDMMQALPATITFHSSLKFKEHFLIFDDMKAEISIKIPSILKKSEN